ncbi:MAG: GNAT family N-acetyltransferase [Candidatus Limnocylindrales bacterium]|jgi:GNAT superfamily N-acetyltransferase
MDPGEEAGAGTAGLLIRRAGPTDAGAIARLTITGWKAAYRGILPRDFLDGISVHAREAVWRDRLERDEAGRLPAWLAERGGRALGFVSSGPPRDEDVPLPAAEVYAIYVRPEEWRRGVGQALLETALRHWRDRGVATLVLWVFEANARARAFYEAMGWQPDGARQELELAGESVIEVRYRVGPGP